MAPAITELLSGSAPPVEFFNPFGFPILVSLYGSGAIIVRELVIRWKKGWASLLMLGAAYGIAEEGLMVKSIFDPAWPDLAVLGSFGRWVGVNWVWALMLTIYHATFSIAMPILIVELMFPSRCRERWVGPRTFSLLLLLISAVVVIGFVWLTPYRPPLVPYAGAVFAVIGIGYAARRIPHQPKLLRTARKQPGTKGLFLFSFLATLCFFMFLYAGPFLMPFPIIIMLTVVVFASLVGMLLADFSSRGLDDLQQFALATGALGFLIVLAPLQELDKARTDNPAGMGIVGLAFLLFLVLLGYQTRRRSDSDRGESWSSPTL